MEEVTREKAASVGVASGGGDGQFRAVYRGGGNGAAHREEAAARQRRRRHVGKELTGWRIRGGGGHWRGGGTIG